MEREAATRIERGVIAVGGVDGGVGDVRVAERPLRIGFPKGRMQEGVLSLMADAGMKVTVSSRGYRPSVAYPGVEAKLLKPQNIVEMLEAGTRDLGFAGADWVAELAASPNPSRAGELVEVLDTGLDKVNLVAAMPRALVSRGADGTTPVLPDRPLVVIAEYQQLAARWIAKRGKGDRFVRSYGATEVFPPEDGDVIIDVAATGATLDANGLEVVETVMKSSTRLYASRPAWEDAGKRARIEDIAMLLRSVLEARKRVMLEVNVPESRLEDVVSVLPCMRRPTVSRLTGDDGYAVKAAVPREGLATLIPLIKAKGGTDVVISPVGQVVP